MGDLELLARRFRDTGHDHRARSALYARLNERIADHPDVVELLTAAPEEQQLPVLLLAAVHSIVLAEPDLELAAWYPTATDEPRSSDPFPAFARLCRRRSDDIRAIIGSRSVQTNEVGRCSLLLPCLAGIADEMGDLALVDVGASAGLNLQLDRYEYRYSPGGRLGGPSTVVLECGVRGSVPLPRAIPTIAARVGIDRSPIDVADPDEARWLMACVWPDQADRFVRLRSAIDIARESPPAIVAGDAIDAVETAVRSVAARGHPVVTNSWVLNYLPEARQREYVATLDRIGSNIDLSWVYAESPPMCPGIPFPPEVEHETVIAVTVVTSVTWRDGVATTSLLGTAHPHGYWLHGPSSTEIDP